MHVLVCIHTLFYVVSTQLGSYALSRIIRSFNLADQISLKISLQLMYILHAQRLLQVEFELLTPIQNGIFGLLSVKFREDRKPIFNVVGFPAGVDIVYFDRSCER